jgi:hypothetical protein
MADMQDIDYSRVNAKKKNNVYAIYIPYAFPALCLLGRVLINIEGLDGGEGV